MKPGSKIRRIISGIGIIQGVGLLMAHTAMAQIIPAIHPTIIDQSRMILAGTGCDASDSVSQITGQQGTILSLNFYHFIMQGSARLSCAMRIPVTIPAGHRMIVTEGAPNGYADLLAGDQLAIASRISLIGLSTPIHSQRLQGPIQADFGPAFDSTISDSVFRSPRRIATACASRDQTGFLGLNIAASMLSSSQGGAAYVSDAQIGVRVIPCQ